MGLGLEYAFFDNWTAKFEYDYLGYGAKNVSFTSSCGLCTPPTSTHTQNVSADKSLRSASITSSAGAKDLSSRIIELTLSLSGNSSPGIGQGFFVPRFYRCSFSLPSMIQGSGLASRFAIERG